jgi:hypothetical protein
MSETNKKMGVLPATIAMAIMLIGPAILSTGAYAKPNRHNTQRRLALCRTATADR